MSRGYLRYEFDFLVSFWWSVSALGGFFQCERPRSVSRLTRAYKSEVPAKVAMHMRKCIAPSYEPKHRVLLTLVPPWHQIHSCPWSTQLSVRSTAFFHDV
jgi:hypothetical protein